MSALVSQPLLELQLMAGYKGVRPLKTELQAHARVAQHAAAFCVCPSCAKFVLKGDLAMHDRLKLIERPPFISILPT